MINNLPSQHNQPFPPTINGQQGIIRGLAFQTVSSKPLPSNYVNHHQSPPAARINIQSPPAANNMNDNYMMHLIPLQVPKPTSPVNRLVEQRSNMQENGQIYPRQFIENNTANTDNRSNRSESESRRLVAVIANPTVSNADNRSRGISEYSARSLNNGKSILTQVATNQYMQPRSPSNIVINEPVRRISNHSFNMSQQSGFRNRSVSQQHNVVAYEVSEGRNVNCNQPILRNQSQQKIILMQNTDHNNTKSSVIVVGQNQFPGTVSQPIQQQLSQQAIINQQSFINQPSIQQNLMRQSPQMLISAQAINTPPTFLQPIQVIQRQIITEQPRIIIQQVPYPTQQTNYQTQINQNQQQTTNLPSNSNFSSDSQTQFTTFNNIQKQNTTIRQTNARPKAQSMNIREQFSEQQSQPKKPKIQKQSAQSKQSRKYDCYQQYYNDYDESQDGSLSMDQLRQRLVHNSGYVHTQKMFYNSRRLIDEIFDNQTHKALLQMRTIQLKSRQKSMKKGKY